MKILLTSLTFFIISTSNAQSISEDEMLHFATGAAISSATYAIVYSKTKNKKKAFWYSLGLSTLAGFSKEIFDKTIVQGRFDTGEAVFTGIGGLAASYTFNIFTGKKKKNQVNE
ncbi:hypothetical protein [uncultured Winogradskyella sp.]|uniref:hypothetical protein n=1 Tax=uncultured Winogradskyella sp. TaxID=395353 RepID=UPI002637E363|nr:hypothetical protein [uncultured Winogradskyella sp.]|tara:strand:- start:266 stop:607 length:342 start_codon:yes stop_codon:yes gene_type:complete